jgi:hypothetical protein
MALPDFVAGPGYTSISRGITKAGNIRGGGDNWPFNTRGQLNAGVLPNDSNTGAAVTPSDLSNAYIPPGTRFGGGDIQHSVTWTAAGTAGAKLGNFCAPGNTGGGGDSGDEGKDTSSSKRG